MSTMTETSTATAQIVDAEVIEVPTRTTRPNFQEAIKIIENGEVNQLMLPTEKLEKYKKMSAIINPKDINSIANFGVDVQSTLQNASNSFLTTTKMNQLDGDIKTLTTNLMSELNKIDLNDLQPSTAKSIMRKIPILNLFVKSVDKMVADYKQVKSNTEVIINKLDAANIMSQRDNNALQVLLERVCEHTDNLNELIIAGKIKQSECKEEIKKMIAEGADAFEINNAQEFVNNLDIRLANLLSVQAAMTALKPKISMVQHTNIAITNKIQVIKTLTMPLIEGEIALAIALDRQKNTLDALEAITDYTNNLMVSNAENAKKNAIRSQKAVEGTVISVETLKKTYSEVVETYKAINEIHKEGASKRRELENQMRQDMSDMEKTMNEISYNSSTKLLN